MKFCCNQARSDRVDRLDFGLHYTGLTAEPNNPG